MSLPRSFVKIGRVTKPHGILGDVNIEYFADSLEYLDNNQIYIKTESGAPKVVNITSWRERGSFITIKFKEVNSRTEAEFLRNHFIVIDESLLSYESDDLENSSDYFDNSSPYLHHLLGITVVLQPNSDISLEEQLLSSKNSVDEESELGIIEDIIFPAGQELWVIKNKEQKEILFPAVAEFVNSYDLNNKKVYINPPEGLIELYLNQESKPKSEKKQKK